MITCSFCLTDYKQSLMLRREIEEQAMAMKVREAIRTIEKDGWRMVAQRGSHRQYKHPVKAGRVTISGKPNDDLYPKTAKSILQQAGLQ